MATSLPMYHPFDDTFINHPDSFKFVFTSKDDVMMNELDISIDSCQVISSHSKKKTRSRRVRYENKKNVSEKTRPIPSGTKKKYPTKPKNRSKIEKMKSKNDDIKRMM